jgi:hypothetical protein
VDAPVRAASIISGAVAVLAGVQWLASRHIEPFFTYLYFFSWIPFLWTLDRLIVRTRGRTYFGDASARASVTKYAWLAACSTTVWLVFEVLNFRLLNWLYIGVPPEQVIRWPGYALSFTTVLPGLLFLTDLLGGLNEGQDATVRLKPDTTESIDGETVRLKLDPTYSPAANGTFLVGVAMLALPMIWPRFFFPLIWLAFIFLLDPFVSRHGGRSLLAEWRRRDFRLTRALLLSGLICGGFWEACNFLAGAKWIYDVPFLGFLKIFEMPLLGFLGFPVFALEAFVMTEAAKIVWRRQSRPARWLTAAALCAFWIGTFAGIDRVTVRTWRAPLSPSFQIPNP